MNNVNFHPDDINLHIYMAMPTGFGERATVVIARNPEDANNKALAFPNISEAVSAFGSQLQLLDATKLFYDQGWEIFIARRGNFH